MIRSVCGVGACWYAAERYFGGLWRRRRRDRRENRRRFFGTKIILYLAALALLLLVEPHRFYNRKNPWLLRLAWGMGVAVLVLLGCVLEASVGIRLLRFVVEKL